ncbi:MAG: hypothetical protein K2P86_06200 [Xanthobacteraceae bacterium]|nr:hypothetical protein [Xanthobacteraceae bacterium]
MKLRAIHSPGRLLRRLRSADAALREAALDAAAEALRGELERNGENMVFVQPQGLRRSVGSADPADAVREFGTPEQMPIPWLASVLPLALEPMRAAVNTAAARAVSSLKRRKK